MPRQQVDNPVMGGDTPEVEGSTSPTGSVNTVTDAAITANMKVFIVPTNAAAGLLARTKTMWVDTIAAGSFVLNVSATAAGAPDGTETFDYLARL